MTGGGGTRWGVSHEAERGGGEGGGGEVEDKTRGGEWDEDGDPGGGWWRHTGSRGTQTSARVGCGLPGLSSTGLSKAVVTVGGTEGSESIRTDGRDVQTEGREKRTVQQREGGRKGLYG